MRDVCRARWCSRAPASGAGPTPTSRTATRCAPRWTRYTSAVAPAASYQELNERHLAFHVSLVGLTGSPRLVAMAESLMVELKLALAQVDRIRRNAHDQADSPHRAGELLERGDVDGGRRRSSSSHLADAEASILERAGPRADLTPTRRLAVGFRFLAWLLTNAVALAVAAWLFDGICFSGPTTGQDEVAGEDLCRCCSWR